MDGWMDGWVGGWVDGWVDEWMNEWLDQHPLIYTSHTYSKHNTDSALLQKL